MKQPKTYPVPYSRDPFVNTPLVPAGIDPETGSERFFITTWNSNCGALSALVDDAGNSRIYRYKRGKGLRGCGAYSAVLTDPDTMWICSDLAAPGKLTLSTGEYEFFESGARSKLVFAGMQYDPNTGKIMAISCVHNEIQALSFDTKTKKPVKVYDNFTTASYSHGGFPNADGKTYTMRLDTGLNALYQWDPVAETLTEKCLIDPRAACVKVIRDDEGKVYIPFTGWLDTTDYSIHSGPTPELDMTWFGRIGTKAYGVKKEGENDQIYLWDMTTGKVTKFCSVPNGNTVGTALTKKGEILAVNVYGIFYKFSAEDGSLRMTRTLDSNAPGSVDCIIRANDRYILGTPFITQRFWLIDTKTGKGFDAGRAAPGGGEVLQVWNMNGKVYMGAYTEDYLVEFDPDKLISFPENPRLVAQSPTGMRPVAKADDGVHIYIAANHHYGEYGCVLTRYNTLTGDAFYSDDPIPLQAITSLRYNKKHGFLLGGSTIATDCDSAGAKADRSYVVQIDPQTLTITNKAETFVGCKRCEIVGAFDDDRYLVRLSTADGVVSYKMYSIADDSLTDYAIPEGARIRQDTKYPGIFVLSKDGELQIWRFTADGTELLEAVSPLYDAYTVHSSADDIFMVGPETVYEFADILKPYA